MQSLGRFQRFVLLGVACLVALSGASNAGAATSTDSADQILSALAEVVKDRAKLVASQTIRNNILDELCEGTLNLTSRDGQTLKLRMGGSAACKADPNEKCNSDDQFVDSCTVLDQLGAPLTDPTYLKRFGRDALRFGFRVSGAGYTEAEYSDLNIRDLSDFVYDLLDVLSHPDVSPSDLAQPLLAFADRLADGRTVAGLNGIAKEAQPLLAKLSSVSAQVSESLGDFACEQLRKDPTFATRFPALARTVPFASAAAKQANPACAVTGPSWQWLRALPDAAACSALPGDLEQARQQFRELFLASSAALEAGYEKDCASLSAAEAKTCHAAIVALRLYPALAKAKCANVGQTGADLSRDLRNLYLLFGDAQNRDSVRKALKAFFPSDAGITGEWEAVAVQAQNQLATASGVGQYELAGALRLAGGLLQAYEAQPAEVDSWLLAIRGDLEAHAATLDPLAIPTLSWANREALSLPVRDVRDALVTVLLMPRMRLVLTSPDAGSKYQNAVKQVAAAIRGLSDFAKARSTPAAKGDALRRFAKLLQAQAAIVQATGEIELTGADASAALARATHATAAETTAREAQIGSAKAAARKAAVHLTSLAGFLKTGADISEHVADGDWVGVGVVIADQARENLKSRRDLATVSRSLAFSRVLLSAYQAKNKEDAKAVFEGALEDVASREQRYDRWSVDVAVLPAARGGVQRRSADTRAFYGMYAPVGPQFAYKAFGSLLYPVDIGAYLVDSGSKPESSEALRFGGACYVRVSASVPFVFGVGADYRPELQSKPQEWRANGFVALELPLYTIY